MDNIELSLDDYPGITATVREMVERHMQAVKEQIAEAAAFTKLSEEDEQEKKPVEGVEKKEGEDKDKPEQEMVSKKEPKPEEKLEKKPEKKPEEKPKEHPKEKPEEKPEPSQAREKDMAEVQARYSLEDDDIVSGMHLDPELRRELIARVRQRLIEETPRITLMHQQLQETRDLLIAFQKRTEKVRGDIRFIQLMAREAHERMERIELARERRAALERDDE